MLFTCRRHPTIRFMAECYACKQELHDLGERNRQQTARINARTKALTAAAANPLDTGNTAIHRFGAHADDHVTHAEVYGTTLIVTFTISDDRHAYTHAVETYRQPTNDEIDPEAGAESEPGEWILFDSAGVNADQVDGERNAQRTYVNQTGRGPADELVPVAA